MVTYSIDTFTPLVGHEFVIRGSDNATLPLILVQADSFANESTIRSSSFRIPFSLLFRGPFTPMLSQGMYHMEQASLEPNLYFLVPVARKEDGMYYEAVFN